MRLQLVETAARLLDEHGRDGVTVRSLAREVGASTQAVYTHFDGVDAVLLEVCREAFRRFGAALDEPAVTDDPVADWMTQGWGYRRFALRNPHLYHAMFGAGLAELRYQRPEDVDAAACTFLSLLVRLERCRDSGRWTVDDVFTSGEVVWAVVHGHLQIELTGYFASMGRDAGATFEAASRRVALGFGDDPALINVSIRKARRRAQTADRN